MLVGTAFIVGLILLVWSADRFILGASATASILGVPPLMVGILIVGIGTSAPEMLVSAIAAYDGQVGLSVGNALGSNITNIGLVLGFTALCIPLTVQSKVVMRELPLLLLIMLVGLVLLWDGELNLIDGVVLFSGFAGVIVRQLLEAERGEVDVLALEFEEEIPSEMSLKAAIFWLFIGLVVLMASARMLVWSAVSIAQALGISDLVIGLTVVAVGTSLPELAASVTAARKNEHDIAIGNVIGSNMFNLLGVMAMPAVIAPGPFDPAVLSRDYPLMLALTSLFLLFSWTQRRLNRLEGAVLLSGYIGYIAYLGYSA